MWNTVRLDSDDLLSSIDEHLRRRHIGDPCYLPDLAGSSALFAASDYMGEQAQSAFNSFSFVLTHEREFEAWNVRRGGLRVAYGLRDRRISYSKLRDKRKAKVADAFLAALNNISGVSVTILFDKSIKTIFPSVNFEGGQRIGGEGIESWRPHVFERMARLVQFLSFFIAGLAASGQELVWVTDEDEIVANESRRAQVSRALLNTLAHLAPRPLGGIYVATTAFDSGGLELEDFAAIPDLIGGAVTEVLSAQWRKGIAVPEYLIVPPPISTSPKADVLIGTLFDNRANLRKLVYMLRPSEDGHVLLSEVTLHTDFFKVEPRWGVRVGNA